MGRTACTEPQCLYKGAPYLTCLLVKIAFTYTKCARVAFNTCSNSLSVGCEKLSFGFGLWEVTIASQANLCAEESLMVWAIKDGGCRI
jgi:hypothetical protein